MPSIKPFYQDDWCTIYHGDCREVLPHIGPVDLVLTDPPYGVEFQGKNTKATKRNNNGYSGFHDSLEYLESVVILTLKNLIETNRCIITPGTRNAFLYPKPAAMGTIFYPSGSGLGRWGFTCSQPILYYGKCPYLAAGLGHRPDSFASTEIADVSGHPCPKPVRVMSWLVSKGSFFGELVLDPFMGSGTTLVAAKNLGRKSIGIEIEEKYCEIAVKRLRQEVLDFGGAVHA